MTSKCPDKSFVSTDIMSRGFPSLRLGSDGWLTDRNHSGPCVDHNVHTWQRVEAWASQVGLVSPAGAGAKYNHIPVPQSSQFPGPCVLKGVGGGGGESAKASKERGIFLSSLSWYKILILLPKNLRSEGVFFCCWVRLGFKGNIFKALHIIEVIWKMESGLP